MLKVLPLSQIIPGKNDRKEFDRAGLEELAASIKEHGLIQKTTVRPLADGRFEIIAGERRFHALQLLGYSEFEFNVSEMNDRAASFAMLIENVSRKDLDPIEEGLAYASRMDAFGLTVEEIAAAAGVSTIRVQFRVKLLKLNAEIIALIKSGQLPLGYAQILADGNLDSNRQRIALAKFRDNPTPTPAWFRGIVSELFSQQAQCSMFDLPLMGGPVLNIAPATPATKTIPTPATHQAPKVDGTPAEILDAHIRFWMDAAAKWNALGKNFKRDQCQAAAVALQAALNLINPQ